MKSIRNGVFETNSSSVHSITIVAKDEYVKWKNGEMLLSGHTFTTKEKVIEEIKEDKYFDEYHPNFDFSDEDEVEDLLKEYEYYTYDNYGSDEYETFSKSYITKSGDEVIAFGYYGESR
jgi:hypothetical protein